MAHMEAEATHTLPRSQHGDFAAPPPRPKLPAAGKKNHNTIGNGHGGWSSSVPPPVINKDGRRHVTGAAHHYKNAHGSGATSKAVGSPYPVKGSFNAVGAEEEERAAGAAAAAAPIAHLQGKKRMNDKLGAQEVAEVAEALASLRGACEAAAAHPHSVAPRGGGALNPPRATRTAAARNAAAVAGAAAPAGLVPGRSADTHLAVVRGCGDSAGDPPSGPAMMTSPEAAQLQASTAAAAARSGLPPMFAHQVAHHTLPPGVDPAMLQQQFAAHYHPQYAPYGYLPAPIPYWAAPAGMLQTAKSEGGGATPDLSMQYAYAPPPPPLPPPSIKGGPGLEPTQQQALENQQQQQYSAAMPWLQQQYLMHVAVAMQQHQQQQPQSQQQQITAASPATKIKSESGGGGGGAAAAMARYPRPAVGRLYGDSDSGLGAASPVGRLTPGSVIGAGGSSAGPTVLDTNGGAPLSSAPPPPSRADIRHAALAKYREKRKARDSNAASKVRYQSRKVLAEARPRVRGQFVRVQKDKDPGGVDDAGCELNIEASSAALAAGTGTAKDILHQGVATKVSKPSLLNTLAAPDKGSGDDDRDRGGNRDMGSRPESAPNSGEGKVSDREEEDNHALYNGATEEAMEYDCQEEDLGETGEEEEEEEPFAGAPGPAEAEIGVGVAEMVVAEPTPTANGPASTGTNIANGGGGGGGGTGRRMTRSQAVPKPVPAAHLTGHKHGRQQSSKPPRSAAVAIPAAAGIAAGVARGQRGNTPGVVADEDPGSNQTKTTNNNNNGGSDSGSNSPQEEVGPPTTSLKLSGKPPPAKQQHR